MAFSFNGSNQYLATSTTPITNQLGDVTMACWFRSTSATSSQVLLAIDNLDANGRYILAAAGAVAGDPVSAESGNNITVAAARTSTGYSANTWTHAAGTFSGASNRSAFINGGSKVTDTTGTSFTANPTRITIGALNYTSSGTVAALNGDLAEIAIWNAALTDAEILSLARGFTPDQIRSQSLQFYAPLVRDLVDVRGGRAITNVNSATVATHPRIIT